jgi:leucyl aminopeptidase
LEIQIITADIINSRSDVIVLPCFEGQKILKGNAARVDQELNNIITQLMNSGKVKGKQKEITPIFTLGKIASPRVMVLGFGKEDELNPEKIRVSIAEVCKAIKREKYESIDFVAFDFIKTDFPVYEISQSIAEGALLGDYAFTKYKNKEENNKEIKIFNIIVAEKNQIASYQQGCKKGLIFSEAVLLTRDMVNEPSNHMTPAIMAEIASQIAKTYQIKIEVLNREEMRQFGMGGILGVAQGSQEQPKFIVMEYNGSNSTDIDVALVGKAITFDSGGISIKPSENMGEMKGDMAGGASVVGAMKAIAQLKPKLNVLGIIPATENMPGGTAMKPGDIIRIMDGKTVEIISTDAEGRLILADGICFALKKGAKRVIDVATLTGGCRIALGDICTAVLGNDQYLIDSIISAGSRAGECLWQLPVNEEYKELNKSDIADIKNSGGRYGSAISAALFLGEFAGKTPWAHLDIAGTSMADKDRGYLIKGATGVPVRTLLNFILSLQCS